MSKKGYVLNILGRRIPLGYNLSGKRACGILNRIFKNPKEYRCSCKFGENCDTPHEDYSIGTNNGGFRPCYDVWVSGDCAAAFTGWWGVVITAYDDDDEIFSLLSRERSREFNVFLYEVNAELYELTVEQVVKLHTGG
ncbi:MAG: hypothetical protein V1698_01690 [bacterium]